MGRFDDCKADHVPEGFRKLTGATTAPRGWVWYGKGSRFVRHDYQHILVSEDESRRYEMMRRK